MDVARFRLMLSLAVPLWVVSAGMDWAAVTYVAPGNIRDLLIPRAVRAGVECLVLLWLARTTPSRRGFTIAQYVAFVLPAACVAWSALVYRGITSPYAHAIISVLALCGLSCPRPVARALPLLLAQALIYPLVLLGGSLFLPALAAQLGDPLQYATFIEDCASQLVAVTLVAAGGHVWWNTRRELLVERQMMQYQLIGRLGEGAMGEVWRAWHPGLGQYVAMKILKRSGDQRYVSRFEQEILATATLSHPNTVRVYDCGVTAEGLWYYTMELLQGETLRALISREGPQPFERAAYLTEQAARALAEAHARGMVHRDVKPENILVATHGGELDFVKVLDFGIARIADATRHVTGAGARLGTPSFMSPEQAAGRPVDLRTDVYALGAVLYFMLTGQPPFDGATPQAILQLQAQGPARPPSALRADLPLSLDHVVTWCLQPDPDARPAHGGIVAEALRATGLPQCWVPGTPVSDDHPPMTVSARVGAAVTWPAATWPANTGPLDDPTHPTFPGRRPDPGRG